MNEICAITGLPGKIGIDGSHVAELYDQGKLKEIDDYCETDVANTYLLYLNYCLLSGIISRDIFMDLNRKFMNYLREGNKDSYNEFLEQWEISDTRGIFG
jgi:predicted PolB exonuclease-like 3'-5' exonuclease